MSGQNSLKTRRGCSEECPVPLPAAGQRSPIMRSRALTVVALLALGACSSVPSASALKEADYGARPAGSAQNSIRAAFTPLLLDAGSAQYQFSSPEQGWGRDDNGFVYGWVFWTQVNSKNQFGAYTGWKTYKVLTQNGEVHSIYEPQGNDLFGNPKFDRLR
jgi:hypothetical protein